MLHRHFQEYQQLKAENDTYAEAFAGYLQSGTIPTFLEDDLSVWKTWITDQQITDYNMKACWNRTSTSCIHWCSLMDSSFRHLENLAQQIRSHRIIRQLKSLCYVIHKCSKGASIQLFPYSAQK